MENSYVNLTKFNKLLLDALPNEVVTDDFDELPSMFNNLNMDWDTDVMISRKNTYVSMKDFHLLALQTKEALANLGLEHILEEMELSNILSNQEYISPHTLFVRHNGPLNDIKYRTLKAQANTIRHEPYVNNFVGLYGVDVNLENTVALDFEFNGIDGATEFGCSYYKNGELVSEHFLIDHYGATAKNVFAPKSNYIKREQLPDVIMEITGRFDNFVFFSKNAEEKIILDICNGTEGTPFDGTKGIIDLKAICDFIHYKQIDRSAGMELGARNLNGYCNYVGIKADPKSFHNASNDTSYTLMALKETIKLHNYELKNAIRQYGKFVEYELNADKPQNVAIMNPKPDQNNKQKLIQDEVEPQKQRTASKRRYPSLRRS